MSLGWPGCLRVPLEELEEVAGEREVWADNVALATQLWMSDGWKNAWIFVFVCPGVQ